MISNPFDLEKPTKGMPSTYFDFVWDLIAMIIILILFSPLILVYLPIIFVGIVHENWSMRKL